MVLHDRWSSVSLWCSNEVHFDCSANKATTLMRSQAISHYVCYFRGSHTRQLAADACFPVSSRPHNRAVPFSSVRTRRDHIDPATSSTATSRKVTISRDGNDQVTSASSRSKLSATQAQVASRGPTRVQSVSMRDMSSFEMSSPRISSNASF